jgi:hypothetical protein
MDLSWCRASANQRESWDRGVSAPCWPTSHSLLLLSASSQISPDGSEAAATIKMEDKDEHHPGKGVWMLKLGALKKLVENQKLFKRTSHEHLAEMQAKHREGFCRGSQMEIMTEKLGMFEEGCKVLDLTGAFEWITFKQLPETKMVLVDGFEEEWITFKQLPETIFTVLTYTWADSKWSEMLKAWLDLPKEKLDGLTDDSLLWIDIFCLDQFHPDKMDTIRKSADIYGYATRYYVIGLAIFDRVWCLAEIASVDQKMMVLVDGFEEDSFLWRREDV